MLQHKTVTVVVLKDDRVLLVKRPDSQSSPGKWVTPGGHVEDRETVNLAALREMQEEIGGVENLEQIGMPFVHDVNGPKSGPHQHICQIFKASKSDEPIIDKTEADDWGWFKPEEAIRLDLTDWAERALREVKFLNRDHKRNI